MGLGFRSDPQLAPGPSRPTQSADRSMARVGGVDKTSGKLIERSTYMSLTVMERKVVEQQAHTQPAASLPSAPRNLELPAARKSDLPLSLYVSPSGGKPGRAGSPHAAG